MPYIIVCKEFDSDKDWKPLAYARVYEEDEMKEAIGEAKLLLKRHEGTYEYMVGDFTFSIEGSTEVNLNGGEDDQEEGDEEGLDFDDTFGNVAEGKED